MVLSIGTCLASLGYTARICERLNSTWILHGLESRPGRFAVRKPERTLSPGEVDSESKKNTRRKMMEDKEDLVHNKEISTKMRGYLLYKECLP